MMRSDFAWGQTAAIGACAALLVMAGCGSDRGATAVSVRDSAGIRIVEVSGLPTAELRWALSPEPRVVIGGDTEDERAQLFRISGVARRSDGRLLIGNSGTSELRLFEADGTPARSFGRSGGGPGEFGALSLVGVLPGDSALIHDATRGRLTIVTPEMTLGRTAPIVLAGQPVRVLAKGLLGAGPMVATGPSRLGASPAAGLLDPEAPLYLVALDGTVADSAGAFTTRPLYLETGRQSMSLTRVPFGTETQVVAGPDRLHVGTGDAWEIRTFDRSGRAVRILRVAAPRRRVTDADIASFVDGALENAEVRSRAGLRRTYDAITVPEEMPAYGDIRADAAGCLWIQGYRAPGDPSPSWTVFDARGEPLGRVALPPDIRVEEIGVDYLIGTGTDDLGRPYVALWELDREAGS